MSRYTGPRGKPLRRLGIALSNVTAKDPDKDPVLRRPYPPGQHGPTKHAKPTEFGVQLLEKQKLRVLYGIQERPLRNLFRMAKKSGANAGLVLLQLLERKLDVLVLRAGFATSIGQARQFVSHGYFTVDGRRVDVGSFRVPVGAVVAFSTRHRVLACVESASQRMTARPTPPYLEIDRTAGSVKLLRIPERDEITVPVAETLVVEYYAQRA